MRNDSGQTRSVWMGQGAAQAAPLASDAECDVCVVGAGMAGLSVAYALAREGRRVVVLDDGPVAGGETSRTTAHLAAYQDDSLGAVEKAFGADGVRTAVASHAAAIDEIERIAREEQIDCEFRRVDGWLFLAPSEDAGYLDDELAVAGRAGLAAERRPRVEGLSWDSGPALRIANQAQFDPAKYLAGVAGAIARLGGRIHAGTRVEGVTDGEPCEVRTKGGHTVRARDVVVCTNSPMNDVVTMHTKQAAYRTYVVAFQIAGGAIPAGLWWDTGEPYHYVRLQHGRAGGDDVLIVGGEDHKTGQADDMEQRFDALERWTRERFREAGAIVTRWSGQVMEPADYMGYIGRNPGDAHVYIATGDSGQGMTHGTIAGLLVRDLVLGRPNAWTELYDPSRLPVENVAVVAEYVKENLNVTAQYADLLTPGEVDSVARIAPGEGAVVRDGLRKIAAYRADDGALHVRSAVCTHLGCIVDWNATERSWDCPCHGSRFDATGRVLNGPASRDLATLEGRPDGDAERPVPHTSERAEEQGASRKVHGDKLEQQGLGTGDSA